MSAPLLTPIHYTRQPGKWPYLLTADLRIDLSEHLDSPCREGIFLSRKMKKIAALSSCGILTIFKGYAWNGCTGVPTPTSTVTASCVHDCLYQFLWRKVWTRKQADAIFYHLMKEAGFPLSSLYYTGVRIFGGLFTNSQGA